MTVALVIATLELFMLRPVPIPPPSLAAVNVLFQLPECDDRADSTRIDVTIARGATIIAQTLDLAPRQHFKDPGTYGPYPVTLVRTISKADFTKTHTEISIRPSGHDAWWTKVFVDALFEDNTHLGANSCAVITVSDDRPYAQFPNRGCQSVRVVADVHQQELVGPVPEYGCHLVDRQTLPLILMLPGSRQWPFLRSVSLMISKRRASGSLQSVSSDADALERAGVSR